MSLSNPSDPGITKALTLAVRYLALGPRTSRQVQTFLKKKGVDPACIQSVVTRLKKDRYIDDREFAKLFIDSRRRNNPKSKYALAMELKAKGILPGMMDEYLEEMDDLELALSAVHRKITFWVKSMDKTALKKKIFNYLSYRGFGFEVINEVWQRTEKG